MATVPAGEPILKYANTIDRPLYDKIGQLVSWTAQETNATPRLNEQLGFGFDAADNLHLRTNNALQQTFTVDAANQLSSVARIGTFTESGATPAPATNVTVNGQSAQTYGDFTFAATNLSLLNGNNSFTNIAKNVYGVATTNTLTANLPTSVTLSYDNNGNLTNDGTRSFAYDCENQLTNVLVAGQWYSSFVYDGLNRRRIARDYSWSGSAWVLTNEVHYVYDRLLAIQERDTNNNTLATYTRGLDLSGSIHCAGGIGGLLARTDKNGSTYYHADGAGNITALIDGSENISARYLYGPFGKPIGQWGPMASVNAIQSSSMFQHDGITLYPFRGYASDFGRWLNQDPIQENGGINLYEYVRNNPVRYVDPLGLQLLQIDGIIDTAAEMGDEFAPRPVGVPPPRVPGVSYPKDGPFPPSGTVENPNRPGKFGFEDPQTGRFRECWRFDKGDPNKPGWRGIDHSHYWDNADHMENPPPFQWFSVPPVMNNVNTPSIYPAPPAPTPPPVQYYHRPSYPMA
jgi:RHS repeat-associated protein